MSDISVVKLREKVDEFLSLKKKIKQKDGELSYLNNLLKPVVDELNVLMEALSIDRFEGSLGKISRVVTDYVTTPQTDEDKEAFHNFLKSENLYDDMVTVNFQRLNSFYKDRLAQAIEEGQELSIPGLTAKQRVEIRKSGK